MRLVGDNANCPNGEVLVLGVSWADWSVDIDDNHDDSESCIAVFLRLASCNYHISI